MKSGVWGNGLDRLLTGLRTPLVKGGRCWPFLPPTDAELVRTELDPLMRPYGERARVLLGTGGAGVRET